MTYYILYNTNTSYILLTSSKKSFKSSNSVYIDVGLESWIRFTSYLTSWDSESIVTQADSESFRLQTKHYLQTQNGNEEIITETECDIEHTGELPEEKKHLFAIHKIKCRR